MDEITPFCFVPQGEFRYIHSGLLDTGIESENMARLSLSWSLSLSRLRPILFQKGDYGIWKSPDVWE